MIEGDDIGLADQDIIGRSVHQPTHLSEFINGYTVTRTSFETFREQSIATGLMLRRANGTYTGRSIAYLGGQGGVLAGARGTDVRAMTSVGSYHSHYVKHNTFSKKSVSVDALVTHTSLVEIETGSPDMPFYLGQKDSPTITEGIVTIGGPKGPGLIIRGGKGSAFLEHLIPSAMRYNEA